MAGRTRLSHAGTGETFPAFSNSRVTNQSFMAKQRKGFDIMKLPENPLRAIGSTVFGSLFLGLVLAVLSAGQAGAVSADEDRLLRFAGHDKDNGTVRSLLAEGVSPNAPGNFDGRTAVHNAAKGGAAKNLAAMLQAGGNPRRCKTGTAIRHCTWRAGAAMQAASRITRLPSGSYCSMVPTFTGPITRVRPPCTWPSLPASVPPTSA